MTNPLRPTGRTITASSPERMKIGMPDLDLALDTLEDSRGELFCSLSRYGITIGYVPAEGPVMTFEESSMGNEAPLATAILRHDGAKHTGLSYSGRTGETPVDSYPTSSTSDAIRIHLGTAEHDGVPARPIESGPAVVEVSANPTEYKRSPLLQDALIIGTRAVGAFAIGRAAKEHANHLNSFEFSLGLLVAAQLETKSGYWVPLKYLDGEPAHELLETMKSTYLDRALVPATLQALKLSSGWPIPINSIGNRLPLFGYSFEEMRGLLLPKLNQVIANDMEAQRKFAQRKQAHGAYGSFDKSMSAQLDNFLRNRLGLE